jgi:O-antigen/teichoic acid export membrane protein
MPNGVIRERWRVLSHWRPGGYARASAEMLGWLLLRATLQAASVVLLARWLGVRDYGLFVAAQAIATFFVPLAGLGLQGVVLRDGAREPDYLPSLLQAALRMWAVASSGFGLVAGLVAWLALPSGPVALWALLLLGLGEVAAGSGVELLARAQQARKNIRAYGASMAGLIAARLAALVIYTAWDRIDAQGWLAVYGGSSLLYLAVLRWCMPQRNASGASEPRGLLRAGIPFAVGALSFRLQAEFNKPVLAQLSYVDAGIYSIAQRVVDIASLPLSAMQESLWPRAYADADPHRRLRYATAAMLLLAVLMGATLALVAPLVPLLFGAEFAGTVHALIWLAWLPAVQVVRNVGNARLILAGRAHRLTGIYVVGALAGIVFSLLLIPPFGLTGALLAAYLAEGVLIIAQAACRLRR